LAFVNFLRIESALVAMRSLNGLVWEGYHLTVEVVKSKPVMTISTPNKRELFVAKFPRTFSVLDLNTLFTQVRPDDSIH
jgi:RNA recognition motif-containing protein